MFSFFDDGDPARIRRSILLISTIILVVTHFNLSLVLPESLFQTSLEGNTIPQKQTIIGLWILNVFLILRHALNSWSSWTLHLAGFETRDDIQEKAEHFAQLVGAYETATSGLSSQVTDFRRELEFFHDHPENAQLTLFRQIDDALGRFGELDRKVFSTGNTHKVTMIAGREVPLALKEYCEARNKVHVSFEYLGRKLNEVAKEADDFRQHKGFKDIEHYELMKGAQTRAAKVRGRDFLLSNLFLIAVVMLAAISPFL